MADPMMDFFDDSSLFAGGLEGLSDEGFAPGAVSLVDELINSDFEPLSGVGVAKHPDIVSSSSQQGLNFEQQIEHFGLLKPPHSMGQPYASNSSSSDGGHMLTQHSQYHGSSLHQPSQTNGLFPDNGPMWGNQDQNANGFHQLPQQPSHHRHIHQHRSLQPPQHLTASQALHQQGKAFPEHQECVFYHGSQAQKQQQRNHHGPLQTFPINTECNGTLYRQGGTANTLKHPNSHMDTGNVSFACGTRQQGRMQNSQGAQKYPSSTENMVMAFPRESSSGALCTVRSGAAYCSPQYRLPGQPVLTTSGPQSSTHVPVNTTPSTNVSILRGSLPAFSGAEDAFSLLQGMDEHQPQRQVPMNQAADCSFQTLQLSGQTQEDYSSSEIFSEDMSAYSGPITQHPSASQETCGPLIPAASSSGYEDLVENLLPQIEAHTGEFEGLEAHDLLEDDLLPQLEPEALSQRLPLMQHKESNYSWTGGDQERSPASRLMDYVAQPRKNTNGSSNHPRVPSPAKNSSSSSSSVLLGPPTDKRAQRKQLVEAEQEDKQEEANRIISEAVAKAGEQSGRNIPRLMSPESLPCSSELRPDPGISIQAKDRSSKAKAKQNAHIGKIIIKFGKKKKRKKGSSESSSEDEAPLRQSPKVDDWKRRSNRQVKRKKYTEEGESLLSEEEARVTLKAKKAKEAATQPSANPSEEDGGVVDKIMSSRFVKMEVSAGAEAEVEQFFVKYKNYSYLHCEWATEQQLMKDRRIQQKIKRFHMKQAQRAVLFADMEEDPFNPDYVEVDRVLEVSYCEDKDTGEPVVYYLVKWCSLPYEDSTWELRQDVDLSKIEEFERRRAARPDPRRVERPPASQWKKRGESREYCDGSRLRDYQLEGVNWLLFNWYNRRNCILADEMGLGKTIQSIAFLEEIHRTGIQGPFLIVAPLSTIANWEREFHTWTNLNVVVYHGSMVSRRMLQQYEMYFRDSQGIVIPRSYKFQAIITTFEMILGGCPELNAIDWRCIVIDEAHRLKNRNCKLLEGFKLMTLEHKVLLTGTPLQNTVEELFSLLHFLEPSRFPSEATFMQEFGDLKTEEQVQKLQAILKPMMLRRLKEDVEKKLAPKEETIIEVELTNIQKKYYRAILEKNFSFLAKGASQANVPNLVNTMMELRKCCNHPYLIKGAEEKILEDFREVYSPASMDFHLQAMVQSAGKLVLLDKLLPKMKAGGHKVLIFSQMVRCLDILEDYLIQRRYLYERIDGRVRGNLRQAAIDRFSRPDSDRFVFLLCTRAGGLGINLTAADTCVIFDSDWNPQNDLQAQARCHRIGQNKAVKVYRLITRNSYEREMFDRASLKLGLDKAVLQSMSSRENVGLGQNVQQLSKKEIEDLLKRGAYGALMEEEDEGSKFCEEDIDQILQRRTKTITIESEGRGSTFAKASFVASGNRTDISLDDPNFWDKWAKKAEIDVSTADGRNSLVIDTPRVRKQTRPFSATKGELAELTEGDSDREDKPKLRRPYDRLGSYGRTECFRVEKNLLVYGWGRWKDILQHGRFKRPLSERDVEVICRALLAYCLLHYRGDDKIRSFMWDLIAPCEAGQMRELQNHLGLSTPVPRGRKGKKVKAQSSSLDMHKAEWIQQHNPEHILQNDSYKKHLKHHCNKVLLRVRMLYYLKQEVIGNESQKVLDGVCSSEIEIRVPEPDHSDLPAFWWDLEADKCLLIGVYKHGYEKYSTIRADPALCFLERVGRPDEKAIAAEQRASDFVDGDVDDPEYKPVVASQKDDIEDDVSSPGDLVIADSAGDASEPVEGGAVCWPTSSALTARLRRLITASQRYTKSRQILRIHQTQQAALAPAGPTLPPPADAISPKMAARIQRQQRWTRREEADFYRVVSTFGVVFNPDAGWFDWTEFRAMARLHKKTDESLQKYLGAFTAMCRRVCRLPACPDDSAEPSIFIQPITEERASRTLYRIELLRKVREQVLCHPQLGERLALCQPGPDLPAWWEPGPHDRDLLVGAAKHGVSRTDYHILRDPELSFMAAQSCYGQQQGPQSRAATPLLHPQSQAASTVSPSTSQEGDSKRELPIEEQDVEGKEQLLSWSPKTASRTPAELGNEVIPLKRGAGHTDSCTESQRNARKPCKQRKSRSFSSSSRHSSSSSSSSLRFRSSSSSSSSSGSSSSSENGESDAEEGRKDAVPVLNIKSFDDDSVASLSTMQDETQDGCLPETSLAVSSNPFQAGYMLAASSWPKDRVIINRLDSICQTVLKGRWPTARRACEGSMLSSFYTTKLLDSPTGPRDIPGHPGLREDRAASPRMAKQEGSLKMTFQKQSLLPRRPLQREEGVAGQQQYLARLHDLQAASDGGLSDFTKSMASTAQGQAALNRTTDIQPMVKKKRGRRKNVEGAGILFMGKKRAPVAHDYVPTGWYSSAPGSPALASSQRHRQDPEGRVPVINLKDGNHFKGDDAPKRKDLEQWLREHPGFVADVGTSLPGASRVQFADGRPRQKRHRCRNPSKMDVKSLTGEERVQIINRRNARKVGGALAPPLKDLCRFLQENPEYGVPPEWAEVVKQSGYLPESMFDRILTGPVIPEEVSRRGRRPKSTPVKAAPAGSTLPAKPLLANGLLPGMDLSSLQALQQNLQSLQALQLSAGLMGLPGNLAKTGGDAGDMAAMFPMMLSDIAGPPNLLGKLQEAAADAKDVKKKRESNGADPLVCGGAPRSPALTPERTKAPEEEQPSSAASVTSPLLALNSLLLSSMLYPGLLLSPDLNLPLQRSVSAPSSPPGPPGETLASVSEVPEEEGHGGGGSRKADSTSGSVSCPSPGDSED